MAYLAPGRIPTKQRRSLTRALAATALGAVALWLSGPAQAAPGAPVRTITWDAVVLARRHHAAFAGLAILTLGVVLWALPAPRHIGAGPVAAAEAGTLRWEELLPPEGRDVAAAAGLANPAVDGRAVRMSGAPRRGRTAGRRIASRPWRRAQCASMEGMVRPHPHRPLAKRCALAMAQVAWVLLADGAHAQTSACDQLKARLATRINPAIRDYTMEAVTADTPVPPGAKVIGTCEGGAWKIVLHRLDATPAASGDEDAAAPASAPSVAPSPAERPARSPVVPRDRASQPVAASPSGAAQRPGSRSVAAASAPVPILERERKPAQASASGVEVVRSLDRLDTSPAPVQLTEGPVASVPPGPGLRGILVRHWHWILAPVLLVIAGLLWAWLAHRTAYDEAGLPRGPKLRP